MKKKESSYFHIHLVIIKENYIQLSFKRIPIQKIKCPCGCHGLVSDIKFKFFFFAMFADDTDDTSLSMSSSLVQFYQSLPVIPRVVRVFQSESVIATFSAPSLRLAPDVSEGGETESSFWLLGPIAAEIASSFSMKKALRIVNANDVEVQLLNVPAEKIEAILKVYKRTMKIELYKMEAEWHLAKSVNAGDDAGFADLMCTETSVRVALHKKRDGLGVAIVDDYKKWAGVVVLQAIDWKLLLDDFLGMYLVGSVVVCLSDWSADELEHLKTAFSDKLVLLKKSEFECSDLEHRLNSIFGTISYLERNNNSVALQALGCLIKNLNGDENYLFENVRIASRMKLDKIALRSLNVFPLSTDKGKQSSLFGILNKCRTVMGSRLLHTYLNHPLVNLTEIERRLNFTEVFVSSTELRQSLNEEHLKIVPDLDRLITRLQKHSATIQDCVLLYNYIQTLPFLLATFKLYDGPHRSLIEADVCNPLVQFIDELAPLVTMMETTIDLEAVQRHEYNIAAEFSPELKELAAEKDEVRHKIDLLLQKAKQDFDVEVKLNHSGPAGYHFRVSRKDEKAIRSTDALILETRKDGVRFTTHALKSVSARYSKLCDEYEQVQKEIVKTALDVIISYISVLDANAKFIAELDVFCAFAIASTTAPIPYSRPHMLPMGSGILTMTAARHPCLEYQVDTCIANDVCLNKGENVQIITGPNMGGKSTFIRGVGSIILMAQIGCYVPCASAKFSIIDSIMARVGAGDSQLQGVSTFMAEMIEASTILKNATSNSLLIIDELGRGTSTYEGYGLAYAIAEHIAKIDAFALFATHFHELTRLASAVPSVINKHVTAKADETSITMLYKVQAGPCDRSFGVHVAEMVRFPPAVIEIAKRKISDLENYDGYAIGESGVKKAKSKQSEFLKAFRTLPKGNLLEQTKQLIRAMGV